MGRFSRDALPSAAAVLLLLFAVAVRKIDHDESQYVAAVALMRHGLPFRDFVYLQTPLQPLLFAPLGFVRDLPLLLALRAANLVAGLTAAAAVAAAAQAAGGDRTSARLAALLMLCSDAFLFACGVARNDTLPAAFLALGIWSLIRVLEKREGPRWMFAAGLCLAAAASTKISYAIPAAGAGLFLVTRWREVGTRPMASFLVGAAVGSMPTLWMAVAYPDAFWFGVLDYGVRAPAEWNSLNAHAERLSLARTMTRTLVFLLQGPALAALAILVRRQWCARTALARPSYLLLAILVAAGVVAALLPHPTYRQYIVPILPPLFVWLGTVPLRSVGRGWQGLLALGAIAGLGQTALDAGKAIRHGSPPMIVAAQAAWVGARTPGPVATVSPQWVAGGGASIDPRFAAGPFVFRTVNLLTPRQQSRFHAVTRETMAAAFAEQPPAAIVTGQERDIAKAAPRGLDQPLADWAFAHNYRAERSPSGLLTLYLPPAPPSTGVEP